MFDPAGLLRFVSAALELPVQCVLLLSVATVLWELGVTFGERLGGLERLPERLDLAGIEQLAQRRIDRCELMARIGPMAGLMGTLIPLGPGLAALGQGDVRALARAVTVAFDTTVVGLAIGVVAFCLHRSRRRSYEELLQRLERERSEPEADNSERSASEREDPSASSHEATA